MENLKREIENICCDDVFLIPFCVKDISPTYIQWLNDPLINRFLEVRHEIWDLKKCIAYIKSNEECADSQLFGIHTGYNNIHIGNIRLGFINRNHKTASIALFIGNQEYWGRGFGKKATKALVEYAFEKENIEKLYAGMYEQNFSSINLFKSLGFEIEALFYKHCILENERVNLLQVGLIKEDYMKKSEK